MGRLKYAFPLVQMCLAAWILRVSFLYDFATRHDDSRGLHPAFELLLWVNLPVSLPVKFAFYDGPQPSLLLDAWFVGLMGAMWYGIALWADSYRRRKVLLPYASAGWRVTIDSVLITIGALLAWFVADVRNFPMMYYWPHTVSEWLWSLERWGSKLCWPLGVIIVFGYDLGGFFRDREKQTEGAMERNASKS